MMREIFEAMEARIKAEVRRDEIDEVIMPSETPLARSNREADEWLVARQKARSNQRKLICSAESCNFVCDRERGHLGSHRSYNEQIDEPVFWSQIKHKREAKP